ncbi:hypothetical protein SAMN04487983_105225 [Streptomyces sp. yr375]|uniref:hypothetical protein n=1 Tax=Streptomyces sp. yr375 TaxID=1761906 RepID=UPI0008B34D3A|nr:hypothetical protein [Streptomyces sp. yr375]SES42279.1 hypothetical protein SAMN04487983_105225 [Streptomyces sp. yr375]
MDDDAERDDTAHDQADLIPLLLQHLHAPLAGTTYLRGVLPAPGDADAVRVAVGPVTAVSARELTLYEFPLVVGEEGVTAYDVIGMLRTLCGPPSGAVGTVMGMPLVLVDPAVVDRAPETAADRGLRLVRTLVRPYDETWGDPLLHGFLFLDQDRVRLYFRVAGLPGVTAADVRTTGALTALTAALPSLLEGEGEQMAADYADPHCARVLDATYW